MSGILSMLHLCYSLLPLITFDRHHTYLLSRILIVCTSSSCRCLSHSLLHSRPPSRATFLCKPGQIESDNQDANNASSTSVVVFVVIFLCDGVLRSYIFFLLCWEMHSRDIREITLLWTRAYIRTLARSRPGLLPLLTEKSVSLPRPGRRSVDTTTTTLARRPQSTLSHPGIFVAHSRLRPCRRNAPREHRRESSQATANPLALSLLQEHDNFRVVKCVERKKLVIIGLLFSVLD